MQVGNNFLKKLQSKGYTLKGFADKTNLNRAGLHRLAHGKRKGIEFRTLEIICKELGCTPNDLLK
jgi:DNA-binding Xre family transcriptional regulator